MASKFKNASKTFCFCLLFILFSSDVNAQIIINEFSSATSDSDWVEIYNNSDQAEDLNEYILSDASTSGNAKSFSCILQPYGFYVVEWTDRLNNGGDTINLKNEDGVKDCISYGDGGGKMCEGKSVRELGTISSNKFATRDVDGSGGWIIVGTNTKDGPNDGSVKNIGSVCVTPTPVPTSTPTPTTIPTNDPTSTSTSTPSLTPTPTIKPSLSPTPTPKNTPTPSILGEESVANTSGESQLGFSETFGNGENNKGSEDGRDGNLNGKFPVVALLFMVAGVTLIGYSLVQFFGRPKNEYNKTHDENSDSENKDDL